MRNDDLRVVRDVADSEIDDFDVVVACFVELLAEGSGTERRRAHAGIASVDDLLEVFAGDMRLCRAVLAAVLQRGHALASSFEVFFGFVVIFRCLDEHGSHSAGNDGRDEEVGHVGEERAFRRHGEDSDDRARGRRSDEAAAEEVQREDAGHAARDDRKEERRLHEDIREIDFVDTAEDVDDHRARRGSFRRAFAEEPVSEQDAEARARVRFEEEEHRLAHFLGLLDAERREHAVVDGVVEEEDLRRLDDDGSERQEAHGDDAFDAGAEHAVRREDDRADADEGEDGEDAAEDAGREVVHEHLEAIRDGIFDGLVKLLDAPAAQGAHDHSAKEHRDVRAGDDAARRNRADDAAAMLVDCFAAREAEQQRDEPFRHRAADLREVFVREPARRDEESRQKAPCDERADVRHDHAGEEAAKFLHGLLGGAVLFCCHFCSIPQ